ncbi:MAG TPA: class I SAM-dependent methyltransferase [Pyrinomonadaceae bacterium]|jgi:SAM-dependent methyltransferase
MIGEYRKIVEHYENCLAHYGDTPRGVDWTKEAEVDVRYKVMLEVIRRSDASAVSLLDFGCGTSHLFEYILRNSLQSGIEYSGLDLSEKFIEVSKNKFPNINYYQADIIKNPDAVPAFDYIVMNGVLTEKRELSFEEMWEYAQTLLARVFEKARRGVAFNVMAKTVDWERDDLFHLPMDTLAAFLVKKLSRNFIIRSDYGLYEYTTYLYR